MKITKELSTKVRNGKCQLLFRVWVSNSIRPRLKTSLYINPDYFDKETKDIKIPKRTHFNMAQVKEAMDLKADVNLYESRIISICNAGLDNVEITSDWILHVLNLYDEGLLTEITDFYSILAAEDREKEKKIEQNKALLQSSNYEIESALVSSEEDGVVVPVARYAKHSFYLEVVRYCERHDLADSRTRVYKVLGRQVCRFELYLQKTRNPDYDFDYNCVTSDDIQDFRYFIAHEDEIKQHHPRMYAQILAEVPNCASMKFKKQKVDARGDTYVIGMLKKLKTIFKWLRDNGRTTNDPFKGVEIGKELYGDPIYITREERDQIANFDLSSYDLTIAQQRDIFVFQTHVGCRVGDLLSFKPGDIQNGVLEYVPSKTIDNEAQVKVRVPLNKSALALVEKYKGVDRRGFLFPFMSASNYNENIKKVFRYAGITRTVLVRNTRTGRYDSVPICDVASSHMARRTFIGIAYRLTHDPNLIGKMTGHVEGSTAFCRYRKIDDEDLRGITDSMA